MNYDSPAPNTIYANRYGHSNRSPGLMNADRYVVLLDAKPSIGKLPGFFHIDMGKRIVNGFTTSDALYILKFVQKLAQGISERETSANLPRSVRYRICVLQRATGVTLDWNSFSQLVTEAYIERVTRRFNVGGAPSNRLGKFKATRIAAERLVTRTPILARPQTVLLGGERPSQVLSRIAMWRLRPDVSDQPSCMPVNTPLMLQQQEYLNDPNVSSAAKGRVWESYQIAEESYQRVKDTFINATLRSMAIKKPGGKDDVRRSLAGVSGYRYLVERLLTRLENGAFVPMADGAAYVDRLAVPHADNRAFSFLTRLQSRLLRDRVDLNKSDAVDAAILQELRDYVKPDDIMRELRFDEPAKTPRLTIANPAENKYLLDMRRSVDQVAKPPIDNPPYGPLYSDPPQRPNPLSQEVKLAFIIR